MHANTDFHIRRLIYQFTGYEVKRIVELQSHCENMSFSEKVGMTVFFNEFYSISWELRNKSSDMYINGGMQKIPNGLFYKIFNILPYNFWII